MPRDWIKSSSKELAAYFCWFVLLHPDMLNVDEMPDVREVIEASRPVLLKDGREKFFQDFCPRAGYARVSRHIVSETGSEYKTDGGGVED
jgi:hypothetical protein